MKHKLQILVLLLFPLASFGQLDAYDKVINIDDEITESKSNLEEIAKLDLRHFWFENKTERRLCFIGDNYRRLKIVFLSVIENNENPNEYFVYGKSNVSDNVCPFQGKIAIKNSYYLKTVDNPVGSFGVVIGEYTFNEDPESHHAGIFKGIFATFWYKDANGIIKYDNRGSSSAMYNNNQFAGTWTEYNSSTSQAANWGDRRIPESGDLDVGTSEFGANEKYIKNGWESFIKAWRGGYGNIETEEAHKKEAEEWWKEK